jgi:hypothetical protein
MKLDLSKTHEQVGTQHVPKEALLQWMKENAHRIPGFKPMWRGPVFYAVPTMHMLYTRWAFGFLQFLTNSWQEGDVLGTRPPTLVHLARQELVDKFLESECEWLFWCDDDVVPPRDALYHLIEGGERKVTAGLVHFKEEPYNPNWYKNPLWDEEREVWTYETFHNPPHDRVVEIDSAGLACVVVHREVVEAMEQPAFSLHESAEDHGFFRRVREAGFRIHGHPGVQCFHVGSDAIGTEHWLAFNQVLHENPFFTNRPDLIKEYEEFSGEDASLAVRLHKPENWGDTKESYFWDYFHRDTSVDFARTVEGLKDISGRVLVYGDGLGSVTRVFRERDISADYREDSRVDAGFARERTGGHLEESWQPDAIVVLDEFAKLEASELDSFIRELSDSLKPSGVLYFNVYRKTHKRPDTWHEHQDLFHRIAAQGFETTHMTATELCMAVRK